MVGFGYLYKGVWGLGRAHRANALAGHLGTAVVAGYFFGEDQPALDSEVYTGIEKELDRIIRGEESLWFDSKKTGVTISELFEPFPEQRPQKESIPTIAQALSGNIQKTRQSGHNVIFAAIAIRALHDHPDYATPSIIDGICKLIRGFNGAVPGRGYCGKQRGWIVGDKVSLPADDDFAPYKSEHTMIEVVIDDLIRSAFVHRRGFGGLHHIINHATGLTELSQFGYRDLARKGFAAHRHHIRLWRSLPNVEDELGAVESAKQIPGPRNTGRPVRSDETPLGSHIKTLYGFFALLRFVRDSAKRREAGKRFLYLMA
jgi:hypothetical protein